jgi:teichuronic acid biosynthesis glycosyltransferase TuaG
LICSDKRSGGPATGRNRGVRESNANLIAFLDADDVWHPQKLELQIVYAFKNFENVFTCTSMHDFRFDGELEFPHLSRGVITRIGFREQCFRARIPASSVVMTRSLALAYPFNESPNYKAVEDFDCWLRILSSGVECSKLTQSLLYYRKSNSQISKSKVEMLKKVFMVHRSNPRIKFQRALLYTISHAISGIYYRLYKKSL